MNTPTLFVVATPIGNLQDMSTRAIETLQQVDLIAAEDTRHSAPLMQHFAITTPMMAVHDHNERQRSQAIVTRLQQGQSVALISDAGTPLISDPGYHLVSAVREAGFKVVPIAGPSALIAALSVAGVATDKFTFMGFLPAKSSHRCQVLQGLQEAVYTHVFYESPHRIMGSVADMLKVLGGERHLVVARELTKTYETVHSGTIAEIQTWLTADSNQQRGEFVLILAAAPVAEKAAMDAATDKMLLVLLEQLPIKKAAAVAAKLTPHKKQALYDRALMLQGK
ncbi:MAG: 16S rRNA (cytidine(1402)-2'-O)-methyltransferase [Gammaproteobacteria bacterium]|jgi:16S rRNA (cytidine1402-2'-O)-methyltransferase|nr:16S rRNA (cytidine(1402)-2'-O)-methyltransferase [Gammaproteobacteria bacterium]MDP6165143.1 16S rRNA (cytidine(1402)-2'-O)-methyltransferase [Gammaproteobacteria bacterium]